MDSATPLASGIADAVAHTAAMSPTELFMQADSIVKTIMILLVLASVLSWGVIFDKLVRFRTLHKRACAWLDAFQANQSLAALGGALKPFVHDPFAKVYRAVIGEWEISYQRGLYQTEAARDSLKERLNRVGQIAIGVEIEQLQRGLPILATVGAVAPFVGLFGTVWGIMNSFQGIAASGNTSLSVVAPGIAEALLATALGLVAAIPAVIAYNRVAGDMGSYANRLSTLVGVVEVHLSRQLETGEALDMTVPLEPSDGQGQPTPKERDSSVRQAVMKPNGLTVEGA